MSDDKARDISLKNIPAANQPLRNLRNAEADEWTRSHGPSSAAQIHLAGCLAFANIAITQSPHLRSCLRATEPAAALAESRVNGLNERDAVTRTVEVYGGFSPGAGSTQELADIMYAMPTDAQSLQFRANLFSRCLTTSERS
jgi:hypothetical protein